jgi:hypothetical protein
MKKLLTFVLVGAISATILSGCQDQEIGTPYQAYFSRAPYKPTETNLFLYLNCQAIGQLPFRIGPMTCENDTLKESAIYLPLTPGKYILEAKDQSGVTRTSATLKVTGTSLEGTCTKGTVKEVQQNDCLLVELDY